jgi:aerobic carbon-monoxide dehydrogenase small subunit
LIEPRTIRFTLNGAPVSASIMPYETLIDVLSMQFELKGARESCGQGLCGCCTVYVDSKAVSSCLYLASFVDGTNVVTVEGISRGASLDLVQQAFIDAGAFQCGFCTPGFIMMVKQLLDTCADPSDQEIRHYLTGNLCRCSAYPEIVDAVRLAASRRAAVISNLPALEVQS